MCAERSLFFNYLRVIDQNRRSHFIAKKPRNELNIYIEINDFFFKSNPNSSENLLTFVEFETFFSKNRIFIVFYFD